MKLIKLCLKLFLPVVVEETDDNAMEIEGIGDEVAEEIIDDDDGEEQEEAEELGEGTEVEEESLDDPDILVEFEGEKSTLKSRRVLHLRNSKTKQGVARLQEGASGSLNEIDNV